MIITIFCINLWFMLQDTADGKSFKEFKQTEPVLGAHLYRKLWVPPLRNPVSN